MLLWFCPEHLQESILGDLHEQYEINLEDNSRSKSNWLFIYNGLRFIRLSIIKRKTIRQPSNPTAMYRNYFKTSIRSLLKNKFFFTLNVTGLSIGIAACLLCYLHIQYELSYDRYNSNADNIYRLVTGDVDSGNGWVKVSAPMPPNIQNRLPEVEAFTRLTNFTRDPKVTVEYNNNIFSEDKLLMADPAILTMFDFKMIRGDKASVLSDMNSIVISQSMAKKYFASSDPLGEQLRVDSRFDFTVTGIYEDVPHNAHFDMDFLISFQNLERVLRGTSLTSNWGQFNYFAYLQLSEGSDRDAVQSKIQEIELNIGTNRNLDLKDIGIQSVLDIHFVDNRGNMKPSYNFKYIYIYTAIAVAILFISFINFVNLSIAASTKRIKEVGVRKVVGALRGQLISQFVTESLMVAFFALAVALVLSYFLFIPAVNELMESQVAFDFSDPMLLTILVGLLLLISLSSGSYIAFFVVSFQPIMALKGAMKAGGKGRGLKNALLGLQFLISTVLIVSSVFIYQQLMYMKDKDLGLDKDRVVNVALNNADAREKGGLLKSEISQISGVKSISASSFQPGGANGNHGIDYEGKTEDQSMFIIYIDEDFIETVGLELVEGDLDQISDPSSEKRVKYILNESARKMIGWETALGKSFTAFGSGSMLPIDGVVKDYNFRSLHFQVSPCVLAIVKNRKQNQLTIKVSGDIGGTMAQVQNAFHRVLPEMEFEYTFMDEQFDKLYKAENRTSRIVGALTVVAIVLAVLGLYALLTYAIQERTKELAIRKVLGIKLKGTLFLLSNNYVRIMAITNIMAIPITFYMLDGWLGNFSYRIDLSPLTFGLIIAASFIFIFAIAGMKTFQTERINPTQALRND